MSKKNSNKAEKRKYCGIVMPISAIDGLTSDHWKEVLSIISESILLADFEPNLVSNGSDVGVIQKRIIQNLYNNPIVVCDVSAKNPNVMFELGLRLAFDKPTIIIKDDKTKYSFDTSPIEHLEYPRDLRFSSIVKFKEELSKKIQATYQASVDNPKYTTFLKHFGEYKISNLEETEITSEKYILESVNVLKQEIQSLRRETRSNYPIDIDKYFDRDELKWRVFNKTMDEFVKSNNLHNEYEIIESGLEKEFINFISNNKEVNSIIKFERELERMIKFSLEKPDLPF